ncbi:MAG TPA: hypothetical protein VLI92_01460 [Candidatus Saccharimonadales bacterium]|nr:hypothetical protein [Candidatus Saccharimonadales bacterium]
MNIAFAYNVKNNKPSLEVKDETDGDFDSPETIDGMIKAIQDLGHSVIKIEADDTAFTQLKENKTNIDLLFNIAEGLKGDARESQIPLFCEILGIPYTHSSPTTHAIKLDKEYTKLLLRGAGIRVPNSIRVLPSEQVTENLEFPVIVKPNAEGSSIGIFDKNVVSNLEDLNKVLKDFKDQNFKGELLVEEFIEGREFTVAVLGNFPPQVLPIIEQRFDFLPKNLHNIAGYELKWIYEDSLKDIKDAYYCPAPLTPELQAQIEKTTLEVYKILRVKDAARLDYRLNAKNELFFIEINTLPGLNPDPNVISYFPLASRTAGMDFSDIIKAIIENARKRYHI